MATLRDIQRRIRSVQSTQKITRAMKLVAAAKLRRAQERILAARPYAAKMAELVATLVRGLGEDKHPLLVHRDGGRKLYVVIAADKGLAGAFNANVMRRALDTLRTSPDGTASLVAVGRKTRDFFRRREWKIRAERIGFLDRLMIRFIMLITHGPTDPRAVVEFTDWNEVEAFGRRVVQL